MSPLPAKYQRYARLRRTLCHHRSACSLIAGLMLPGNPAHADIQLDETYHYYDISGQSAAELRDSIDANRHLATGSSRFDAMTDWNIKWQYNYQQVGETCVITRVDITVEIDYRLPRWQGSERERNPRLAKAWQRYIEKLLAHEQMHGQIAIDAAAEIEDAIHSADNPPDRPPPGSCEALEVDANANGMTIIEKVRARQAFFDLRTDHGANDGATFP